MSCDLVLVRAKNAPSSISDAGLVMPPFGILNIAIHLRRQGFRVELVDRFAREHCRKSADEAADEILAFGPDVVGISAMTSQCGDAMALGDALMRKSDVRVVYGGTHFSSTPEDGLAHGHAVVCGEGELCLAELLPQGKSAFEGIIHARKMTEKEMDSIPFPGKAELAETAFDPKATVEFPIITARGCPFDCNFCKDGFRFNSAVRSMSVRHVVDYLATIWETLGFRRYFIMDDIFTLSMGRLEEMSRELDQAGLDLRFRCFLHANTVTPQRLELACKMGVDKVSIGVESGNDEILKIVGKGTTTARQRSAIELCKEFGLHVTGLNMIGNTGESVRTIVDTIRFAHSLPTDHTWFSFAVPFPGTPFAALVPRYGKIIEPDFSKWNNETLVYLPDEMTVDEMHHFMNISHNVCTQEEADPHGENDPRKGIPRDTTTPRFHLLWTGSLFEDNENADEARSLLPELPTFRIQPWLDGSQTHGSTSRVTLPDDVEASLEKLDRAGANTGPSLAIVHSPEKASEAGSRSGYTIGRILGEPDSETLSGWAQCQFLDEFWVTDSPTEQRLSALGVTVPILVMPRGVDANRFRPDPSTSSAESTEGITFLALVDGDAPRAWEDLLTAWERAFSSGDSVSLRLAVNSPNREPSREISGPSPIERVEQFVSSRTASSEGCPPIEIVPADFATRPVLYSAANVAICGFPGTGWSAGPLEAMASGLPILWTEKGHSLEALRSENTFLPESEDRIESLVENLRKAANDHGARKSKSLQARKDATEKWTWSRAGLEILDRLTTLAEANALPEDAQNPTLSSATDPLDALLSNASQHQARREYGRAIDCIRQALQLTADDVRVYEGLGSLGLEVGNREAIVTALRKISDLQPTHPLVDRLRGELGEPDLPTASS